IDGDRVLEVPQQDVHRWRDVGHLRDHLLVGEVQEMNHPGRLEGDLANRLRGVDREGLEEVAGVAQNGSPSRGKRSVPSRSKDARKRLNATGSAMPTRVSHPTTSPRRP